MTMIGTDSVDQGRDVLRAVFAATDMHQVERVFRSRSKCAVATDNCAEQRRAMLDCFREETEARRQHTKSYEWGSTFVTL